ncbi:Flp family type IVb pilin [Virgibacillus sp. C22-A2]|uniref:Flp family type IVb pilin n=1 Tax=Virgibacillus tibetensis TaxID=3042313 RepID=A0ABU6KFU0_9BACI|nr:Flp family type IVb pilin [Virgibacillus sp. C22-A2]
MMNHLSRLVREEEGQAMTEYGLLVGLISIAVIAVLALIGPELVKIFTTVKDELTNVN